MDHYRNVAAGLLFERRGTAWALQTTLVPSGLQSGQTFTGSVALDGTTALVGMPAKAVGSNVQQGAVYVFAKSGDTWTQQAELRRAGGQASDFFGTRVALDGATAIVGAIGVQVGGNAQQGVADVFVRTGSTWTQQAELVAADGAAADYFGAGVGLSGTTAIVGASGKAVGANATQGAAYLFVRSGTTWTQQARLVASDGGAKDLFGTVAISGGTALVGAPGATIGTAVNRGAAYSFISAQTNGDACSATGECDSGFCVDGVCCDGACDGTCRSCRGAATGGADGTCALVLDGLDPRDACPGASTCAASSVTAHVCDGAGACTTRTSACANGCDAAGIACVRLCAGDDDCDATTYCKAGLCAPREPAAVSCTAGAHCASGFCIDGVCCATACTGQCEACAEPGSIGTCVAVKGTPRAPSHPGCGGLDPACAGSCDGVDANACAYPTASTACGNGCVGGVGSTCDAHGRCLDPAPCARNLDCDATTNLCRATCVHDSDCVAGGHCETIGGESWCMGPDATWTGSCALEGRGEAPSPPVAMTVLALLALAALGRSARPRR
jgi:hypothetical protein